jgi:DNA polymerase
MESKTNIDKEQLKKSLNAMLSLFDESEAVLKGNALPQSSIKSKSVDLDALVDNIADGNILSADSPSVDAASSSIAEEEGLSLSERLSRRLMTKKSQNPIPVAPSNNQNQNFRREYNLNRFNVNQAQSNSKISSQPNLIDPVMNQNSKPISSMSFEELRHEVLNCKECSECSNRKNVLFGEGPVPSRLMVIGEGPGSHEDSSGRLFVGPSGDFLYKWLKSINLDMRRDVYLSNIVKCFSGTNPTPQRANRCKAYLERQIDFVRPQAILVLGKVAANSLFNNENSLTSMRENVLNYKNIPVIVTYHPAAVLRNETWKRPVWEDLKRLAFILNNNSERR